MKFSDRDVAIKIAAIYLTPAAATLLVLEERMCISHTYIYNWLPRCVQVAVRLRCGQRWLRRSRSSSVEQLPDRVGIAQRPTIVDKHQVRSRPFADSTTGREIPGLDNHA